MPAQVIAVGDEPALQALGEIAIGQQGPAVIAVQRNLGDVEPLGDPAVHHRDVEGAAQRPAAAGGQGQRHAVGLPRPLGAGDGDRRPGAFRAEAQHMALAELDQQGLGVARRRAQREDELLALGSPQVEPLSEGERARGIAPAEMDEGFAFLVRGPLRISGQTPGQIPGQILAQEPGRGEMLTGRPAVLVIDPRERPPLPRPQRGVGATSRERSRQCSRRAARSCSTALKRVAIVCPCIRGSPRARSPRPRAPATAAERQLTRASKSGTKPRPRTQAIPGSTR